MSSYTSAPQTVRIPFSMKVVHLYKGLAILAAEVGLDQFNVWGEEGGQVCIAIGEDDRDLNALLSDSAVAELAQLGFAFGYWNADEIADDAAWGFNTIMI